MKTYFIIENLKKEITNNLEIKDVHNQLYLSKDKIRDIFNSLSSTEISSSKFKRLKRDELIELLFNSIDSILLDKKEELREVYTSMTKFSSSIKTKQNGIYALIKAGIAVNELKDKEDLSDEEYSKLNNSSMFCLLTIRHFLDKDFNNLDLDEILNKSREAYIILTK